MSRPLDSTPSDGGATGLARAASWFARRDRRLREAASRADLALAVGIRHSRSAWASRAAYEAFGETARNALYEHIWTDAAERVGARVARRTDEILEISRGDASTLVWRQITMHDDAVTLHMTLDKPVMHRRLNELGVKVPEHVVVTADRLAPALGLLREGTCVVKPAGGTGGGKGVTTGVRTELDLSRAVLRASRFSGTVLVERQPPGVVLRLLFFQGALLDAVGQHPPRLTGDGRSTIAELIHAENQRRIEAGGHLGPSILRVDLDAVIHLRDAGRGLDDVPPAGEVLTVKGVTNENGIGDTWRVEQLSDGLVRQCTAALPAIGLELVGVDLIAADPAGDDEGTVLEVNGGPGLHHHYLVDGEPKRVAVPILETLL